MTTRVIPVSCVDERLVEIKGLVHDLQREASMLENLKNKAVSTVGANAQAPTTNGSHAMGATPAIMDYLRRHPGTRGGEIIEALQDTIESDSPNKRRLLSNTIDGLRRRGRLRRETDGRFFAA